MKKLPPSTLTDELVTDMVTAVAQGRPVRRALPFDGRLYVDRQVPFLCLYRRPVAGRDDGTERLVTGLASYLIGTRQRSHRKGLVALIEQLIESQRDRFGAFLLIELWAGPEVEQSAGDGSELPTARVFSARAERSEELAEVLRAALVSDKRLRKLWHVEALVSPGKNGERLLPIIPTARARTLGCTRLGLEVPPLYRDAQTHEIYPVVLRQLRRVVDVALRKTVFAFAKTRTTRRPSDFRALGRRAVGKWVWQVDRQLAELGRSFDLLLALTPTNIESSWHEFRRHRFERRPEFRYRPLTVEAGEAKRRLFSIPMERIDDPIMADLLRERQLELDRQLTLLAERGTPIVLYGSLQLYGTVHASLLAEAERIIELIPPGAKESGGSKTVTAVQFAARATEELERFGATVDVSGVGVELRKDIAAGLMVSRGQLLIAARSTFPQSRVEALIQHEVGTHVLTYLNGKAQRFEQLSLGLAGYDEVQEGLAVLAEYLVGGMSKPRLRLLAGRVVAAHSLVAGASFIDTFRLLLRYGFSQGAAYGVTARTYRGGGLTKDAVYLRGLLQVLGYLEAGKPIEDLYIGKIARRHVGIMRELRARGVLIAPPLYPRYLQDPAAQRRLARLRAGLRAYELTDPS